MQVQRERALSVPSVFPRTCSSSLSLSLSYVAVLKGCWLGLAAAMGRPDIGRESLWWMRLLGLAELCG